VIFEGISHSQRVYSMGFHTQWECGQSTNDRLKGTFMYGKFWPLLPMKKYHIYGIQNTT
jgi:hypothetical protein